MREKYVKASDCFRRWTACLHTFVTDDRLRSGWFPRRRRRVAGRWGLEGQTSKPSTDPDLQLIQTLDWFRPSTNPYLLLTQTLNYSQPFIVPDPLLVQTFYWSRPCTHLDHLLIQTIYCSRPSPDQDSVVGFSPRIARRSTSWYRQIFAMPEFKGRCVLACLSKKQRQLFLHKSLPAISVDLSISNVAMN